MSRPAHRFNISIAGRDYFGLAFESERDLDEFIGGRFIESANSAAQPTMRSVPPNGMQGARGRPSLDGAIAAAVSALSANELDAHLPLARRARIVQARIARASNAGSVPNLRTIERYLAEHGPTKAIATKIIRTQHASLRRRGDVQ